MAAMKKPPQAGPAASPMMTPQQPSGGQMQAAIKVRLAMKFLEQALSAEGGMTEKGKSILKAMTTLANQYGKTEGEADDLAKSEEKTLAAGASGPGAPGGQPPGGPPPPGGGGAPPPPGGAPPPGGMPGMPGGAGAAPPMAG